MKDKLSYYQNQKVIYTKFYNRAKHNYERHYQFKETAEDFSTWCDESNKLSNKMDYYDMILREIDDIIIALNDIIECEKNIKIYKKRLTNQ